MLLTEEEKCIKGFAIINQFLIDEDIKQIFNKTQKPSYTDFGITAIVLEHINEHYHELSLMESTWQVGHDVFINEELYRELYECLLDESIGSAIANVYNAPSTIQSNYQKYLAQKNATKTDNQARTSSFQAVGAQLNATQNRADYEQNKANGTYGNDVKGYLQKAGGAIKTNYSEWAAKNAEKKAINDQDKADIAKKDLRYANRNNVQQNRDTNRLGYKIDSLVHDPISALAQGSLALGKHLVKNAWAAR